MTAYFQFERYKGYNILFSDQGKTTTYIIDFDPVEEDTPDNIKGFYYSEEAVKAAIDAHLEGTTRETGKLYKVWIQVEEQDLETDAHQEIDLQFAATRVFDDMNEAINFANMIHEKHTDEGR